MKIAVKTLDGKASGDITLDKEIFGAEVRADLLHRMVNYQLAKRRGGNHKVKQRHEISGTGKKPWAQKGTGRARAGDLKRNIDRGGATVFGPVVRTHNKDLPKKVQQKSIWHVCECCVMLVLLFVCMFILSGCQRLWWRTCSPWTLTQRSNIRMQSLNCV